MPSRPPPASASHTPEQLQLLTNDLPTGERRASVTPTPITSASIVRQEANLLRFPFFALGRRGLGNRKGLLIRGQSKLDQKSYDFEYRITCNSDDVYPGQLSRKVHMGLLRLMQLKQPFPYANPIEFTWRELMDVIGLSAGGGNLKHLKQAIRSIQGTRIRSTYALKNANGQHLKSRERGYALYSEYVFFDELMPDEETIADKNFVWLADWYLANINSLYCSPLDHTLWLALDDASPIASRMYEFFTFNFAGDWQTLTIDYEKLHRFLPVARMAHLSQIQHQLGNAITLIINAGVLAEATWQSGKRGQPQLVVRRGQRLAKRGWQAQPTIVQEDFEATEIRDLFRQQTPEDELLSQFYTLWDGSDQFHPTSTDRTRAQVVINTYGVKHAEQLLPFVVEVLRERFPGAKSFGASARYWADAAKKFNQTFSAAERKKQEFIDMQLDEERRRQKLEQQRLLERQWDQLPAEEQNAIRRRVLASTSSLMQLEKHPSILHNFCLKELAK